MSKKNVLPQRNFLFANGGARIELDVDAHADIDYDFFDSGGKTMNKQELGLGRFSDQKKDLVSRSPPQRKVVSSKEDIPCYEVDSDILESVNKARGPEMERKHEEDEKVISTGNGSLDTPQNVKTSKLKLNSNRAGENDISVCDFKDCDNGNKLHVESASLLNPSEPVGLQADSQDVGNRRKCNEVDDVCKDNESEGSSLGTSLQDSEQVKKRNLMNCIAYSSSPGHGASKEPFIPCKKSHSEPGNTGADSASSNTTSEITDVTSRASSSNYSLRKGGIQANSNFTNVRMQQGNHTVQQSQPRGLPMNLIIDPMRNMHIYEQRRDSRMSSSTFLSKSSYGSTRSRILPARKNMSFTNDEMWKIERENESLLKKIEGKRSLHVKPQLKPANFNPSSSAINRRKVQSKIDQENQRLMKKLKTVRPVTDTSGPWRQVRH